MAGPVRSHWVKTPTTPRSNSSPATAWAAAPCACIERSRFLREGGRWYYVDGDMRPCALNWLPPLFHF